MKTQVTLQVSLTEADIFPKSDHFNLPGNRENKFYSNNVWKRDRSTPEVSVFGSENSVHPW